VAKVEYYYYAHHEQPLVLEEATMLEVEASNQEVEAPNQEVEAPQKSLAVTIMAQNHVLQISMTHFLSLLRGALPTNQEEDAV